MSAPKYLLGTHDLCIPKRKKRSKDRESRQVLLTSRVCISAKSLHLCLIPCSPMTAARQAPLSMGFSRQEYGSGLPCPSPEPLTMELMQSRWTAGRAGGYWRVCKTRLARAQEHTGTSRGRSIPHIQEKESTQEEKKKSVSVPVSFYFR